MYESVSVLQSRRARRAGRRLAQVAVASGVLTVTALPATYAAEPDESPAVQEVTVTGSRIRLQTGMNTPVPVTTLSTSDLAALKPGASIGDQLDKLPQLFQTESAQRGSGALFGNAGGTYLNLRGLESKRTLVLLDGSRVVQADRGGTVNVGVFPMALIKSVDIVTGGASAQYGADAVGGVVNFILDRDFEGLKASATTGKPERGGGGFSRKFGLAAGRKIGEKLHVVASVDYNRIDQIERNPTELGDWFQRWGFVTNPAWRSPTLTPGVPQRLTLPNVISSVHSPYGRIDTAYSALSPTTGLGVETPATRVANFTYLNNVFTPDGAGLRPFVPGAITAGSGGTQSMSGGPEFDAATRAFEGGPFGAEVKEPSAFLGLKYDVTDRLRLFTQAMYGVSESNQYHQRGLPHLQDIWFGTIYSGNPYLPAALQQAMTAQNVVAFKMLKLGQLPGLQNWADDQTEHNSHTMFTWSVGGEADIGSDWQVRVNWQQGRSHKFTLVRDDLRVDRMFLALDAVVGPNGTPICRVQQFNPTPAQLAQSVAGRTNKFGEPLLSPVGLDNTISGCVPLNPFGQGNVSQAARDYLVGDKWGTSDVEQDFGEVLLTGKLFEGWAGPIASAFGATYRKEELVQTPFPYEVEALGPPLNAPSLGIRGIPGGFTGGSPNLIQFSTVPPIQGEYDVKEAFVELQVPLFETSHGQRLDTNLAFRQSRYSGVGSVNAYKVGLDFQAYRDLRFRATLSRDVREATFAERFDFQGSGGNVNDPAPVGLNGAVNQSFQITSVAVGNENLDPEKADTITFGAVFRPSFDLLSGLQLSADYYSVKVKDAIGQLGIQNITTFCFTGQTSLCQYVERDPQALTLTRVFNPYLNIAQVKVRGIDFEAQYLTSPEWITTRPQTFAVRAFASRLLERTNIPTPGAPPVHLEGGFDLNAIGGPQLYPTWKGNLSVAYTLGAWTAQVSEEWISRSKLNVMWVEGVDIDDNWLSAYLNTNLKLGYNAAMSGDHNWDVALYVTNLFDKDPIIVPRYDSRLGSQFISNNYDAYGRSYALGINFSW
jgi:outer membrane receptor protein involved in Fe transport